MIHLLWVSLVCFGLFWIILDVNKTLNTNFFHAFNLARQHLHRSYGALGPVEFETPDIKYVQGLLWGQNKELY